MPRRFSVTSSAALGAIAAITFSGTPAHAQQSALFSIERFNPGNNNTTVNAVFDFGVFAVDPSLFRITIQDTDGALFGGVVSSNGSFLNPDNLIVETDPTTGLPTRIIADGKGGKIVVPIDVGSSYSYDFDILFESLSDEASGFSSLSVTQEEQTMSGTARFGVTNQSFTPTAAVPEPSSLALLASLAGIPLLRRRKGGARRA